MGKAVVDQRYTDLMKSLRKQGVVIKTGGMIQPLDKYRLPTGSLSLDIDLKGGFPTVGVIQIKGIPSAGKTFLLLSHIRELERLAKKLNIIIPVLWVAFEEFDVAWARNFFNIPYTEKELVEFEQLYGSEYVKKLVDKPIYIQLDLHQPDGGGEGLEVIYRLLKENVYWAIGIDSIGALKPEVMLDDENTLEKKTQKIASRAQLLEHFVGKVVSAYNQISNQRVHLFNEKFRWEYELCTDTKDCPWCKDAAKITRKLKKGESAWEGTHPVEFLMPKCGITAINQVRAKFGGGAKKPGMAAPPPDASSGYALAHAKRIDLRLTPAGILEADVGGGRKITYGRAVKYRIEKSKVSGVLQDTQGAYNFFVRNYKNYNAGTIDRISEVTHLAAANGIIEKSGSWIHVKGQKFQGDAKAIEFLLGEPEVVDELAAEILELHDIRAFDPYPTQLGELK